METQAYLITEKQNLNTTRKGMTHYCRNLTHAKSVASHNQHFHGTILTIEQNGIQLAYKTKNNIWINS